MPPRTIPQLGLAGPHLDITRSSDPFATMFHSLALCRSLGLVARLGLFTEMAEDPADVEDLATRFALQPEPLRLMLELLAAEGWLEAREGGFAVASSARYWLDPDSASSVITALSESLDYWPWWNELDQVAVGGAVAVATMPEPDDEVGWLRRIRGQFEYARRIGEDVADAVDLPAYVTSLLDVGGAHGWFSAVLCKRNPMLRASVVDAAPATAVGRELMWETGMERVVSHRVGDIYRTDLGGPFGAAFCAPLMHGMPEDVTLSLLQRIRSSLQPGGLLITVRTSRSDEVDELPDPLASARELFLRLARRDEPSSATQFRTLLASAGFSAPRITLLESAPDVAVYVARAI